MATKLIQYQMPSRQMISLHVPENGDHREVVAQLENEFSRLSVDQKNALEAQERKHQDAVKGLEAEIETLKGAIAGELVKLRKQRTEGEDFNEKEEAAYYMGLTASRLIVELRHEREREVKYAPATRPAGFNGGGAYSKPGVAWE